MFKILNRYIERYLLKSYENILLKEHISLTAELEHNRSKAQEHKECIVKLNPELSANLFDSKRKYHQERIDYFRGQCVATNEKILLIKKLISQINDI